MKKILAILLASAMALGLAACGSGSSSDSTTAASGDSASEGGTTYQAESVVVAADDDSFSTEPWSNSQGEISNYLQTLLWAHLATRPSTGAMIGDGMELVLAKEITQEDETTWKVVLYDNITDSKGNAITAEDVKFSFEKNYELGYYSYVTANFDSCEVVSDTELTLTTKSSDEGSFESMVINTAICDKDWYESATDDDKLNDPAATGAYYLVDFQNGHSVTVQAREDYWKDEADLTTTELHNVKTIQIIGMQEESSRAIALENGEVDYAQVGYTDYANNFKDSEEYNIFEIPKFMNAILIFNCDESSKFADVNVRKAVAYALDFAEVYELGNGNDSYNLHYDISPNTTPDYLEKWESEDNYAQDLEKSKEYLEKAGYGENELELNFIVRAQAPQQPYVVMQEQLAKAGIIMNIVSYDRAVFNTYYDDPTAWDFAESGSEVTDFTANFWKRMFSEESWGDQGTENFIHDDKLQELLAKAAETRSEEDMDAFHQYYMYEQCYAIGMYNEINYFVGRKGLTDICKGTDNATLQAMTFTSDYSPVPLQK